MNEASLFYLRHYCSEVPPESPQASPPDIFLTQVLNNGTDPFVVSGTSLTRWSDRSYHRLCPFISSIANPVICHSLSSTYAPTNMSSYLAVDLSGTFRIHSIWNGFGRTTKTEETQSWWRHAADRNTGVRRSWRLSEQHGECGKSIRRT